MLEITPQIGDLRDRCRKLGTRNLVKSRVFRREGSLFTHQVDSELTPVAVDLVGLGVADGGEVDGLRGVDAAGVDHQLQGLQRQRGVLPLCAEI